MFYFKLPGDFKFIVDKIRKYPKNYKKRNKNKKKMLLDCKVVCKGLVLLYHSFALYLFQFVLVLFICFFVSILSMT